MSHSVLTVIIALMCVAGSVLRLARARAGVPLAPQRLKMSPLLGVIMLLLVFILLAACAFSIHSHGFPLDGRFYFLFLINIAGLVTLSVMWARQKDTSEFSTEEKKAGNRFGMVMIGLIVIMPVLGYFHALRFIGL